VTFLTDFADQAVVLPLLVVVTLALFTLGWRRGAAAWLVALAGTLGAMLALKLVLTACAASLGLLTLHSPSGHTAAASVIAGGLTVVLGRSRALALPAAALAAVVIGLSRLALGLHSLTEVLIGGLVGLAGTAVLLLLAGAPPPAWRPRWAAVAAVAVVLLLHGQHLDAEPRIRSAAYNFAGIFAVCRADQARP
jgi:membrane-associated phospholipid phosphatase